MSTEPQQLYEDALISETQEETLWIKEYEAGIHGSIMNYLKNLDNSTLKNMFDIQNPNRVLSEGYRIQGDITVEDFAVTGSQNKGELAIGQVVSSNGKEKIGSMPKDFIQARSFGDRLKRYPGFELEPKGLYVIRTKYDNSEIEKRTESLQKDIEIFGRSRIPVEIYKIEPMNCKEEIKSYYSSLTHS